MTAGKTGLYSKFCIHPYFSTKYFFFFFFTGDYQTTTGIFNIIKARFLSASSLKEKPILSGQRADLIPSWDKTKNIVLPFTALKTKLSKQSKPVNLIPPAI